MYESGRPEAEIVFGGSGGRSPPVKIKLELSLGRPRSAWGTLEGAVALLRRGGGNGFAQKASTARLGGAVGCIIYDGEEECLSFNCMGSTFQGHVIW